MPKLCALVVAALLLAVPPAPGAAETSGDGGIVAALPAVHDVELTGFTRARAGLPLVAESEGRVQAVAADIGEAIGAGGTFARIDGVFIRLELDEVQVRQDQLRSQIAFDEREVKRYRRLAEQNNAAASQLDNLEQTLRNNRHALSQLEVQQRVLEERLRRTRIAAPPGWRVTARAIEPGQWVAAGERIGEVADFGTLVVPFALTPEQHAVLGALAADGALRLRLLDLDTEVPASVYRDNPGFDPQTRKLSVDLRLDAPVAPARGGLRALLALPMPDRSGAVLLPEAALRRSYEEYWVEPVKGDPVRVLLLGREEQADGTWLRVSSPQLAPGDRVRLLRD
jgi:RND family efflux transporter MFP subunit